MHRITSTVAVVVVVMHLTGCVAAEMDRYNSAVSDFNFRYSGFHADYQQIRTEIAVLLRVPAGVSLVKKVQAELVHIIATGENRRIPADAAASTLEARLLPTLTDDERAMLPGFIAWMARVVDLYQRGKALQAERLDLERQYGALLASQVREQEIARGLQLAVGALAIYAAAYAITKPTTCVGTTSGTTTVTTCQ